MKQLNAFIYIHINLSLCWEVEIENNRLRQTANIGCISGKIDLRLDVVLVATPYICIIVYLLCRYMSICHPHVRLSRNSGRISALAVIVFSFATVIANFFEFETLVQPTEKRNLTNFHLNPRQGFLTWPSLASSTLKTQTTLTTLLSRPVCEGILSIAK